MSVEFFALSSVCAVLFLCWIALDRYHKKHLLDRHSEMMSTTVSSLSFVHSFYVGKERHLVKRDDRKTFWADATYSVLIMHRGKPSAVIGFELSEKMLTVCQLQGLKGVYVGDLDLGSYLLECAERIAVALHKDVIRVQPAYRHAYYDLDEEHRLYPKLYVHQARLRQMYDASSKKRGYLYHAPVYFYWYEKRLRKQITFQRFLRLQLLLFNREARIAYRNSSQESFGMGE